MNLKKLLEVMEIDVEHCAVSSLGGSFTLLPIEIAPVDFLMQAEEDFLQGGLSASINCITNSKRAIVCQMDQVLTSFGYKSYSWNIPKKLEYLKDLGLLAPAIIRKVSLTRNLLEHEYKRPSAEDVESCLDIATLFVMATSNLFKPFGDALEFASDRSFNEEMHTYTRKIYLGLQSDGSEIGYRATGYVMDDTRADKAIASCSIRNSTQLFKATVRVAAALETRYRVEDAFNNFNTVYENS